MLFNACILRSQVVIYNLCVIVGVDPKVTAFKCMFLADVALQDEPYIVGKPL
eukprot:COSAG01_NODE_9529_length_2417_cov_63.568162_2_plen_52_part_00